MKMQNSKTKTIGEKIKEDTEWIIKTSEEIYKKNKNHPLYRKTPCKVAELLLTDQHMAIYVSEQTIKNVRKHFMEK